MYKLNSKKLILDLINQDGFGEVAKTLGEVANEAENLIKERNDADLLCAFESLLYTLMDCYKGAGKKNKKRIINLMNTDFVKRSLEIAHWESDSHCIAMKEAAKTIQEWHKDYSYERGQR